MRRVGPHVTGASAIGSSVSVQSKTYQFHAMQVFMGPPRSWSIPVINPLELSLLARAMSEGDVKVYAHAPYVLNAFPTSKGDLVRHRLRVREQIVAATKLQLSGYVIHMGGAGEYSVEELQNEFLALCSVVYPRREEHVTPLLLENAANGHDNRRDPMIIQQILAPAKDRFYPVGMCVDTLHLFAAGYDPLSTWTVVLGNVKDDVKLLHLNSGSEKVICGKGLDRHEPIATGVIEHQAFRDILSLFPDVPVILETPSLVAALIDTALVLKLDQRVVANA